MNNSAASAALKRLDAAYADYCSALSGPPRLAQDAMPGRGARSPKYGRDGRRARDDNFELELRRLLDDHGISGRELAEFLSEHGLSSSADLGEDEPPAFSGRPNTGGRLDPTDVDRDLIAREGRLQRERDYEHGPVPAMDELIPSAARIGDGMRRGRVRARYEERGTLDQFLGAAGARIRNLG